MNAVEQLTRAFSVTRPLGASRRDHRLEEALAHLGAAISTMLPTDDQIGCDHVKEAARLVKEVLRG
jgi:hypothetical protein